MAMDQQQMYNQAYGDALRTNENETQRWSAYRQEHLDLKENLKMYQKTPRADILIPMGTKALLPGQLYHTGEVLVSHGGGYFTECTSEQARSIADRRVQLADEMLQKYDRERTLYSDKLEVPFINEAFAQGGREIIEPYDEQTEERWRAEHRRRVRETKQREAVDRKKKDQDDRDLFEKLEEMELLEELENEMEQLDMPEDDDDQLGRLMRGEIRLNSKLRTAHRSVPAAENDTIDIRKPTKESPTEGEQNTTTEDEENGKISDEDLVTTDDESVDGQGEEDISPEFSQLLNETKMLAKEEKIKIFQAKQKDVRKRLYQNSITITEKVDLYQLYEELEEALDFLRAGQETDEAIDDEQEEEETKSDQEPTANYTEKQRRKISFAEHDEIKLIENWQGLRITDKLPTGNTEKTVFLPIVHSAETLSNEYRNEAQEDEIICPADIFRKEMERRETPVELRSILKNKHFVEKESHSANESFGKTGVKRMVKETRMKDTMQDDILGEIVEHKIEPESTSAVTDLPPQPKKKVSRFKQQRH
ncbi:unconventional prefoldin RPB5 interactor-like protein [Anopheles ziemanni]|uniref:unconventional prefoldin RPB5 interactor-like protein n=1 Tax=Anopheles coustani TaxID=139045 RepID=UPI00265B2A43|nr:unconventional prefoldin RPB5 interactor-like protein [Anopheles coustani]XP_058177193.1 unconventional prefoldin RPB5 interactor-like protein [Anopheles ziemanni]